jgi:hypothetical protein
VRLGWHLWCLSKKGQNLVSVSGKAKKKAKPGFSFVLTVGEPLNVQPSLLETLAIDQTMVRKAVGQCSDNRKFVCAAEDAWQHAWRQVERGNLNPITWLQKLLIEARSASLWFPPVFLLRLRQLQRRELIIEDCQGRTFRREVCAGLPQEFQEFCEAADFRLDVVPRISSSGFEALAGGDRTEFVNIVCSTWRDTVSRRIALADAIDLVLSKLKDSGWRVSFQERKGEY